MTVEGARNRKEPAWLDNLLPGRSERVSERRDRNGERVGDSGRDVNGGDFFLGRPKKPRSELESMLPDFESDLEDGRCFHMG